MVIGAVLAEEGGRLGGREGGREEGAI